MTEWPLFHIWMRRLIISFFQTGSRVLYGVMKKGPGRKYSFFTFYIKYTITNTLITNTNTFASTIVTIV